MIRRIEVISAVSGQFLCEHIPLNWFKMNSQGQDRFIERYIWEPLENALSPDDVYDCIIGAADAVIEVLKQKGIGVSDE